MIFEAYNDFQSIAFQSEAEAIDFCDRNEGFLHRLVTPVVIRKPDWVRLELSLYDDAEIRDLILLGGASNPLSLFLKMSTNGIVGLQVSEEDFMQAFVGMGVSFSPEQVVRINTYLSDAYFTAIYPLPSNSD
jgi:hypothetical protein